MGFTYSKGSQILRFRVDQPKQVNRFTKREKGQLNLLRTSCNFERNTHLDIIILYVIAHLYKKVCYSRPIQNHLKGSKWEYLILLIFNLEGNPLVTITKNSHANTLPSFPCDYSNILGNGHHCWVVFCLLFILHLFGFWSIKTNVWDLF